MGCIRHLILFPLRRTVTSDRVLQHGFNFLIFSHSVIIIVLNNKTFCSLPDLKKKCHELNANLCYFLMKKTSFYYINLLFLMNQYQIYQAFNQLGDGFWMNEWMNEWINKMIVDVTIARQQNFGRIVIGLDNTWPRFCRKKKKKLKHVIWAS